MLHIILVLLKFIGIVLLTLLGLLVTILLVVLLVPVRYRIWVSHGAMVRVEGRVSWILHLIHLRVTQEGEERRIRLRLFGIILYDSARPRKPGKPKRRRRNTANRNKVHSTNELKPEGVITPGSSPVPEEQATDYDRQQSKQLSSEEQDLSGTAAIFGVEPTEDPGAEASANNTSEEEASENNTSEEEMENAVGLLGRVLRRIKSFFQGIRNKLRRLITNLKQGLSKLINIKQKINLIKEFISEEENRKAFGITWQSLKKLLRHVLPRKLRSRVVFGTGDPCSTGQALGVFSMLYGIYGDSIQITPDFEHKVFEGNHYARGRIRMGTLLIIVIKLLLDKKFKQLKRNFKILKEAL